MADKAAAVTTPTERPSTQTVEESGNLLGDTIQELLGTEDLPDPDNPETTTTADTQATTEPHPEITRINTELETLNGRYTDVAVENGLLREQLEGLRRQQQQTTQKGPRTRDQIYQDLENPNLTRRQFMELQEELFEQKANAGDNQVRQESQHTEAVKRYESQAIKEFPEVLENPEFQQMTAQIFRELGGQNNPSNVYTAVATAYARLSRTGKLVKKEETKGPQLRVVRPTSPMVSNGTNDQTVDENDPLSQYSETQIASMKQNAARLEVPWDKYADQLRKNIKADPSYGRR